MIVQVATTMLAVLAGYALGIWHCKRAIRDAGEILRRRRR